MTITLTAAQEKVIKHAIQAGLVQSVDEFIETAIESFPPPEGIASSREEAVLRMQEFGDKHRLTLGEPVTHKLLQKSIPQ